MSYMLLIIEPPDQRQQRGLEAGKQVFDQMLSFTSALQSRGVLEASNSLASASSAARLQLRNGQRRITDGPFTEAKEIVGGFFLLNVATRDEALAIAAECPAAEWATIEVRRVAPCYE